MASNQRKAEKINQSNSIYQSTLLQRKKMNISRLNLKSTDLTPELSTVELKQIKGGKTQTIIEQLAIVGPGSAIFQNIGTDSTVDIFADGTVVVTIVNPDGTITKIRP